MNHPKRKIFLLLLFLILLIFVNHCSEKSINPSLKPVLDGEWVWDYSTGGLWYHVVSPATEGLSEKLVFSAGNMVSFYREDTLFLSSRYEVNDDTLFIEKSDIARQFKIEDDRLVLNALCADCYSNIYHRPKESPQIVMYSFWDDLFLPDDPFSIDSTKIRDDILTVYVKYSGGCENHYFTLFGSPAFMESNPVQAALKLTHNDKDDPCDALISDSLTFDLTALKEAYIEAYGQPGSMFLRIQASDDPDYFEPMPLYEF